MARSIAQLIEILKKEYPLPACALEYEKPHELLFSVRLAAQCTDARVNEITPALYARYTNLEEFAAADVEEVEKLIHSCGFFRTKARDIIASANMLLEQYGGQLPDTMEELLKLPGVGRKTANLIMGDLYGKPAVVTDTHCIRLSYRLRLCDSRDPVKVENALWALLPPEESSDFCHRLVLHGRALCTARSPKCGMCPLQDGNCRL